MNFTNLLINKRPRSTNPKSSEDKRVIRTRIAIIAIIIFWVLISCMKITTSSLALNFQQAETNSAQILFSKARTIRSDEWMRSTPYAIGRHQSWWTADAITPLNAKDSNNRYSARSLIDKFVNFERTVDEVLQVKQLYVFLWWLPVFGTLIFGYGFFRQLGLKRMSAWLGPLMIIFSSTAAWWSFSPLYIFYCAFAGFFLSLAALNYVSNKPSSVNRISLFFLILLAAMYLERLPFLYIVWSVPISVLVASITIWYSLLKHRHRKQFYAMCAIGILVLVFATSSYLVRRPQIESLLNTVYPGQRRSTGGDDSTANFLTFTGAFDWLFQGVKGNSLVGTNQSEAARGLTLLLLPSVGILMATAKSQFRTTKFQLALVSSILVLIFFSRGLYTWPEWIPLTSIFQKIPTVRMNQILGTLVIIPFVLVLDLWRSIPRIKVAQLILVLSLLFLGPITWHAGQLLRENYLPSISTTELWWTTALFALVSSAIFLMRHWSAAIPVILCSIFSVAWVNPINKGFGDLESSPTVEKIMAIRQDFPNARWATDSPFTDALVASTGVKLLSGQQSDGPDRKKWAILDPGMTYIQNWNRGASFLLFNWNHSESGINVETRGNDMFVVYIDPCNKLLDKFDVQIIMSSVPLTSVCLREITGLIWTDANHWVYLRSDYYKNFFGFTGD